VYLEGYSPAGVGALLLPAGIILPRMAQANAMAQGNMAMAGRRFAPRDFGIPQVEAQKADTLESSIAT